MSNTSSEVAKGPHHSGGAAPSALSALNITKRFPGVLANDDVETLRTRILAEEHRLLPEVLQWFAEGRVSLERVEGSSPRVSVEGRPRARFGSS